MSQPHCLTVSIVFHYVAFELNAGPELNAPRVERGANASELNARVERWRVQRSELNAVADRLAEDRTSRLCYLKKEFLARFL